MLHVFHGWSRCGRDAQGGYLLTELHRYLDEEGVDDPGEREAWAELFEAIESEVQHVRDERAADALSDVRR